MFWIVGLAITTSLLGIQTLYADEATLRAEIDALKQKIERLEAKLDETHLKLEKPESPRPTPIGEAAGGLRLSGMVEMSANYNINQPNNQANTFHEFQNKANNMQLDMLELILQHQSQGEHPVAVRADLIVGETAESIGSVGTITDDIDLQQAYVSWKPNILNRDIDIWAGKYVTLAGAEVIPDPSAYNWNVTRSFLFYYAIPFTHTGIRSMIPVIDGKLTSYLGVNNGWDRVEDDNEGKTLESALSITPWEWLSLFSSFYWGNEVATGTVGDAQNVWSNVLTIKSPLDIDWLNRLTLMFDYTLGHEHDGNGADQNSNWDGLASYARYMLTDKLAIATRYEYFNDNDGDRTSAASGIASPRPSTPVYLQEWTTTLEYPFVDELIARLEYRKDWANDNFFQEDGRRRKDQDLVLAELLYLF
jgi:hypothetical protein